MSKKHSNSLINLKDYNNADIKVSIFSAFETSKENIDKIIKNVSKKYNFNPISVEVIIDPTLIGGIKVVFDSFIIDGTIKGKLKQIKQKTEERI